MRDSAPRHHGEPARTRALAATRVGLGMLVVALGACAQQPTASSVYSITGSVTAWREGDRAQLTAHAVPFAEREYALASTTVDQDGRFRLALARPPEDLLTPVGVLFPDTSECSERTVQPSTADVLFVSRYEVTREAEENVGDLHRTSEPREDGVVSETHVFSTADAQIALRCAFDRSTFVFALELAAGWNAYRIHTPTSPGEPYVVTSAPSPYTLTWRLRPNALQHAIPTDGALEAVWPWLRELVTSSGSSER